MGESFIEQSNTKYGNSLVQIKNTLKWLINMNKQWHMKTLVQTNFWKLLDVLLQPQIPKLKSFLIYTQLKTVQRQCI